MAQPGAGGDAAKGGSFSMLFLRRASVSSLGIIRLANKENRLVWTRSSRATWILNQVVICVFGLSVAFHGYRAFSNRSFRVEHYRITLDLGEYHELYGLVLIVAGILVLVAGLVNFWKWWYM